MNYLFLAKVPATGHTVLGRDQSVAGQLEIKLNACL